ncbi:hypothetical protein VIN01S_31150 [Vibrio inusitatus NBRC 102082]|uniref:Uncharacterized protein n=1 Tax=Vibrio inusitatus NBRC 102082 TaxID=1219070 RepID=A0A4Y3HZ66_9VIBR|nr:hypothetical protein VIN01S_31150 [Vibrio inusitatus NBRC 102082]
MRPILISYETKSPSNVARAWCDIEEVRLASYAVTLITTEQVASVHFRFNVFDVFNHTVRYDHIRNLFEFF